MPFVYVLFDLAQIALDLIAHSGRQPACWHVYAIMGDLDVDPRFDN